MGGYCLVTFISSKIKLVSFYNQRADAVFSSVMMSGLAVNEARCLGCLLALKFPSDLKWDTYKQSIAKEIGKWLLLRTLSLQEPD